MKKHKTMAPSGVALVVVKRIYSGIGSDYIPVVYEIEADDEGMSFIREESARCRYERLGKLLDKKGGRP
jgi:hypothetical protein